MVDREKGVISGYIGEEEGIMWRQYIDYNRKMCSISRNVPST